MAVNLSPFGPKPAFINSSGAPLSGGKLFFYVAGSVGTKQNTYTDSTGNTANANPVVLNSLGNPTNEIWLTAGQSYKVVLAPSGDTDPPASPIWTVDNIYGINDVTVTQDQWVAGPAPTYVSATQFTLVGDQTTTFHVGRRVKATVTAGTVYGRISASAYGALTTVTVVLDSGTLDSGLSAVSYGLLSATNTSVPSIFARSGANADITSMTALTSINGGQVGGIRNRLINGGCRIAQRGSAALVKDAYTYGGADRWAINPASFTTVSAGNAAQGGPGAQTSTGFVQAAAGVTTTGTGTVSFVQAIEQKAAIDLNGKTITISGIAYHDTGSALNLNVGIGKPTTTADTFTARTALATSSNISIPNVTYTAFSFTTTLGSADAALGLYLQIAFIGVGAVTTKNFYIGDVQIEIGSVATTFEQTPFSLDFERCKRYYQKSFSYGTTPAQNAGATNAYRYIAHTAAATVNRSPLIPLSPTMRTTPTTVTAFNPSAANAQVRDATGSVDTTSTTLSANGEGGMTIVATGNAASAVGNAFIVHWTADAELAL